MFPLRWGYLPFTFNGRLSSMPALDRLFRHHPLWGYGCQAYVGPCVLRSQPSRRRGDTFCGHCRRLYLRSHVVVAVNVHHQSVRYSNRPWPRVQKFIISYLRVSAVFEVNLETYYNIWTSTNRYIGLSSTVRAELILIASLHPECYLYFSLINPLYVYVMIMFVL